MVHPQVPLLRLQLARSAQRLARKTIRASPAHQLSPGIAAHLGTQARIHFHRWRHTQPVFGGKYRRIAVRYPRLLPFRPNIEVTLEANPGTFEQEKFKGFREAGINRLSVGIQSFNAEHLQILGRVHNNTEALRAADIARSAGFNNFNLNLMFGLPKQTQEQALQDLQQAIDLNPTHLSWYQLTLEPNTLL